MQKKIEQMRRESAATPQHGEKPECRMNKGIVLLGRAQLEPYAPETMPGPQVGPGDMSLVIPQHTAAPRRVIHSKDNRQQRGKKQYGMPDPKRRRTAF